MAQIVHRINLSAATFPFLSEQEGRTVIIPQSDQNAVAQVTSPADKDKDRGIPQIYYCHNVLPTAQGFQSIGYRQAVPGIGGSNFDTALFIRDDVNRQALISRDRSSNTIYILLAGIGVWQFVFTMPTAGLITTAFVSGTNYIYIQNVGCYYYDFDLDIFTPITLSGLDITQIIGITSSYGYLIAWSSNTVAWSSTTDPTDFVPSLATGAGGGSVEGAEGAITVVTSHTLGMLVYTTANIVAGIYSGNSRFPFNYKALVGSGGISSSDLIAFDANSIAQWAYTTNGLQLVDVKQVQSQFSEVTDFISGKVFEDFNQTTEEFSQQVITGTLKKKIEVIADRYLVISYGVTELTHALVYDLIQKRWGKLKVTHTVCFRYAILNPVIVEAPRDSLAFMQKDGTILLADLSIRSSLGNGVLLLGKYQYVRNRFMTMQEINLENAVNSVNNISLKLLTTYDGKNTALKTTPTLASSTGLNRLYKCRVTGLNHSLLIQGGFYLVSGILTFTNSGKR